MANFPPIHVLEDGTFSYNNTMYQLQLPKGQSLTSEQCRQIVQCMENLLKSQFAQVDDLDGMVIQPQGIHFQNQDIQLNSADQEILKQIQEIATQTLPIPSPPASPSPQVKKSKPSLPKLRKNKKNKVPVDAFPWPSESVKKKLSETAQQFKEYVHHLQQNVDSETQLFLEGVEEVLEGLKTFDQEELAECLAWGEELNENELPFHPALPLFFKQEFQKWLKDIRHAQASSWEEVQKTIEKPIKGAYQNHVLDGLLKPEASAQEHQLGQIFLNLYQADRPQFLQQRLQTADKLYASLVQEGAIADPEQVQALEELLQELHVIIDSTLASPSLAGRIKPLADIPSYSKWDKFKKAIGLIFAALGKFFQRQATWTDAQNTPAYLETEHCDFDGELIGKEEVLRHATIPQLIASKQAQLQELRKQNPSPQRLIKQLEKEVALYQHYQQDKTWVPANQLRNDFSHYHHAQKKQTHVVADPQQTYIPAIVNSRIHQLTTASDSLAIHRSGALSYLLDGTTNLIDLKEEVMQQWEDKIPADSFDEFQQQATQFLQNHWNIQLYLALERINKRKRALDDQMVQYVANQVQAHIADLVDPSHLSAARLTRTIQVTQISLLNPEKKSKEPSGLEIDERNQLLDMAVIFQDFDGKQVEFKDVSAPFMEGETIYLPLSFLKDPQTGEPFNNPDIAQPFTLSCTFFNTSVQGLKTNEGEQQAINELGLQHLQQNLDTLQDFIEENPEQGALLPFSLTTLNNRLRQIKERLDQGETGYAIAQELALFQHDMHGILGINCFSGKDRTGYLIALLMGHLLAKQIEQKKDVTQEEKEALKRRLYRDLMEMETGLASQVVHQNTGHKVLKIQERSVRGINEGEGFFGDFIRLGHALFALSAQA